jgi:hypothetical protein
VEDAIAKRLQAVNANSKEELALVLGQAVAALNNINAAIPVQSKHRHLIANELEAFANGPREKTARTES